MSSSPRSNYDALVTYFADHYAFFDLYGVDWSRGAAEFAPLVSEGMTDAALFDVLSDLVRPLRDSHIQIEAEIDGEARVYDGNPGRTERALASWAASNGVDPKLTRFRGHLSSEVSSERLVCRDRALRAV